MTEQLEGGPHIPGKDRVATLAIIWTKAGQIQTSYPTEDHFSLPMLSTALDAVVKKKKEMGKEDKLLEAVATLLHHVAEMAKVAFTMAQKAKAEPAIIPATGKLPIFDPKYLQKPH